MSAGPSLFCLPLNVHPQLSEALARLLGKRVKELVPWACGGVGWVCVCAVCSAAVTVTEFLLELLQKMNGHID